MGNLVVNAAENLLGNLVGNAEGNLVGNSAGNLVGHSAGNPARNSVGMLWEILHTYPQTIFEGNFRNSGWAQLI